MSGVILAGGRSSRFGSDKLRAEYRGRPILHRAIEALSQICDEIVVVLSPAGEEPPLPDGMVVRFARDANEGEGPLAGLYEGLLACRTELVVVAGGDMPELQSLVLSEMLRVARVSSADAVALQDGDRIRPLPCVVRMLEAMDAAHALLHLGGRRLRSMLEALHAVAIDEAVWTALDPERRTLIDVDEPGDLPPADVPSGPGRPPDDPERGVE